MPVKDIALPQQGFLPRPQRNLSRSTAARMWILAVSAFLAVLQSSFSDSFASLTVALSAIAAAVVTELLCNLKRGEFSLGDGSAVASALILTLLLPNRISPLAAAAGAAFAMTVIKFSFGGLGSNWVNPALGGWLFIRAAWPSAFDTALEGSPLSLFGPGSVFPPEIALGNEAAASFLSSITGNAARFLNDAVFSFTGIELPREYMNLLAPSSPGIIADRGLFALLLGTILIAASQVGRIWIPPLFLAVYLCLVRFFGGAPFGGGLGNGDMLFGLFSGGTIAAAFILASDPATGPKSDLGTAVVTVLAAGLAFVLRYWGWDPYGAFLAVALFNILVPLIRKMESKKIYTSKDKRGIAES